MLGRICVAAALACLLVSACSDPAAPAGDPEVELRTDRAAYMVGEMVSVEVANRDAAPVEIRGHCGPFQVEREVEGAWERVPIFCDLTVPPFTARIEAGGTFVQDFTTEHVMATPGTYRFTVQVARVGAEATHEAATAPFLVEE